MLVNGEPSNLISIRDRGLLYGDGVFRTLLVARGKAVNWPLHFHKLKHDCGVLNIPCPDHALLSTELDQLVQQYPDAVLKIIITRGSGVRGYAPTADMPPTRIWDVSSFPAFSPELTKSGVKTRICHLRLGLQPRLAGIKHLNRLENVLAAAELHGSGVDEGILLDTDDHVIEGTRSNLFLVAGGKLVTPNLSHCGVAGVQRDRVISWAQQHAITLQVREVGLDELVKADEVFLVSSIIGLWSVRELEQRRWSTFPFADRIRQHLLKNDSTQ